jgi:hypothetical protein
MPARVGFTHFFRKVDKVLDDLRSFDGAVLIQANMLQPKFPF